ncbi:MAG: NADH-quinone oxidoreductase subunit L [Chloroflexota bacterium]|nr:MAG: NADH-quinone oxidoreductase subunit L [Chloroflexota bacterium]
MAPYLWLIPALPLAAFILITAFLRRPTRLAGYVGVAAIAGSFLISMLVLAEGIAGSAAAMVNREAHGWYIERAIEWMRLGKTHLEISFFVDPIGAVMLVVVTFVSMLVQIYSLGYMVEHGEMDPGFSRFFSFLGLFTFSMLGLVLANNFVQLFVFWELVGLCSYLLVGFWYHKPEAAEAAKKAFITTRFGDLGFLIGILIVFTVTGAFAFTEVAKAVEAGTFAGPILAVTMVLLFCGAIGKSAQFPLHVWLPDAMEGPTPVSALIHAATMVAAGVYMVARLFVMFEASPTAMDTVAWIGAFTAIFAATQGLVMRDIKRVLAYSTVSQLGYMMMALGIGGLAAGVFHLTTHAFFKALLFLGSGSVIHGSGEQDMFRLGGLAAKMPTTRWTFLFGSLALAGIFPFAGFWSKDEILLEALNRGRLPLLIIGIVTAFMTAFYIFRAYFLTFSGRPRGDWTDPDALHAVDAPQFTIDTHLTADPIDRVAYEPIAYYAATHLPAVEGHGDHGHDAAQGHESHADASAHNEHHEHVRGAAHAHESPATMTGPLVVLAIFALLIGLVGAPFFGNPFGVFVTGHEHTAEMNLPLAAGTTALALFAIWLAKRLYGQETFVREPLVGLLGPIYGLLAHRYYLDEFYNWLIGLTILGVASIAAWFDRNVIDRVVNGVGWVTQRVGHVATLAHTGRVPNYALVVFGGIAVIVLVLLSQPVAR